MNDDVDQVAEMVVVRGDKEEREIVGMIRGCIKSVTCGKKVSRSNKSGNNPIKPLPVYTKLAYILGLRVSPFRRYAIYIYIYRIYLSVFMEYYYYTHMPE